MPAVTQKWTHRLPLMQQSVLLTAVRGPDGISKYNSVKLLLKWYRRCILVSAFDKKVLDHPGSEGGGSFTGPSLNKKEDNWQKWMDLIVDEYLRSVDALPSHFQTHFMHACEILGYKHPQEEIREWWYYVYLRLVHSLHLRPEPEEDMDKRLGDNRVEWLSYSDRATTV